MAKFLIDAQLPPSLARVLVAEGHEATHVSELGLEMSDLEIAEAAEGTGCIIISKDVDFFEFVQLGRMSCPMIWIRLGNTTNAALVDRLLPRLPQILEKLRQGDSVVEIVDR